MYKKQFTGLVYIVICFMFCSCYSSKKISNEFNYFQKGLDSNQQITIKALLIQPNDILSIYVSSNTLNQEQAAVFNMFNSGVNSTAVASTQNTSTSSGYIVDQDGYIRFPMLGMIKASGNTRSGLSDILQEQLSSKALVKEPIVQVRFLQLKINILGEVKAPGTKVFTSDRITIIDALGAAGDLTDKGRRDNIVLIREENGIQRAIPINLLNANFMSAEGFQLQQNDLIYVYANNNKLKETKFDPKVTRDLQIGGAILSVFSFVITILLLFK